MQDPSPTQILYPAFTMFYLVVAVLTRLAYLRVGAVGRREIDVRFYRTFDEGREPEHIRVVTRHFVNLFEVPVLFYVVVLMAYVTGQVSWWLVGCGWAYVVLRCVHSWVHLTTNTVLTRFRVYAASGMVLVVMWTSLLVTLIRG